jgi:hypothetical protein
MRKIAVSFSALVTVLVFSLPTVSAQAQSPRTFVSAAGSDSNPCSFAAPCRHFQAAVNATTAGGEVDALDPAGYGPIVISQAVTIEGQGWSYIAPPAGGNGITISAVSGKVTIHGVSLNGAGITGGTNGIVFNSGDSLTVADCVVQNFTGSFDTGNGILIAPTSGTVNFAITNTVASNNGYVGVYYRPPSGSATANGIVDHVIATANQYAIGVYMVNASGGSAAVAISNSVASNNALNGVIANNSGTTAGISMSIDNVGAVGNQYGINALGTPKMLLGRSVITGNSIEGVHNATSPNSFSTYQDNRIDLNTTDISSPLNPLTLH